MILFFLYTIFVLTPVIFWLRFFMWSDRSDPEPKKTLLKLLLCGMGVVLLCIAVETILGILIFSTSYEMFSLNIINETTETPLTVVASMLFLAGIIEELLKYGVLREVIYFRAEFNQTADGIFYGVTLALGFVLVENTLYFVSLYREITTLGFLSVSLIRAVMTTLLHVTATGFSGYAIGRKKFSVQHSNRIIIKGVLAAILLHGIFNVLLLVDYGLILAFLLVFFAFIYLLRLLGKQETRIVWRLITPPPRKKSHLSTQPVG